MEFEQAFAIVNAAMYHCFGRYLKDVEVTILRGSWDNLTYEQIAESSRYSISYIRRHVGAQFWKLLSQALGEPVSKTNFRSALERRWQGEQHSIEVTSDSLQGGTPTGLEKTHASPIASLESSLPTVDWGEAIDVTIFYGREAELDTLHQWVIDDRCRMIALLGMGGMGKSSLAAKIAHLLQDQFEFVIWRSLRNAPPLETLLRDVVPFLSRQQDTQATPQRFLHWLRTHRCLVILDNAETIMQAGDRAGYYQPDYENYGDLLKLLGESVHQSCVILTSREKPAEVAVMEGIDGSVRSLQLSGSKEASLALLESKSLQGTEAEKLRLCQYYSYSPLALRIIASSIDSLFDGEIAAFLKEETLVFNGLRRLLDQQFARLSDLEQTIMYWLAINREWVSIAELIEDIVPITSRASVLETLESLTWRSLIERKSGKYTQQPVIMEYVTEQLIEQILTDLTTKNLDLFAKLSLIKTTVKTYIQDGQKRLILRAIADKLCATIRSTDGLDQHLRTIIQSLRNNPTPFPDYASGNLINLYRCLQLDLTGYDFSHLTIQHACLQGIDLHHVNLQNSSVFKSTFSQVVGALYSIAFSPDGTLLLAGDMHGAINVWQIANDQLLLNWQAHAGCVMRVVWHPNGQIFASGGGDPVIRIWDSQTKQCLQILTGHREFVFSLAWSPDGQWFASSSADRTIKLWNSQTGECLKTLEGHSSTVYFVAWNLDGTQLMSSSSDGTSRLWSLESGECLRVFHVEGCGSRAIAWNPADPQLVSISHGQLLRIWNIQTGECLITFEGHTREIFSVAWSPDGKTLASCGDDYTIKLWDVKTSQCLKTLLGHQNSVLSVTWNADSTLLASGSHDQTVKLWDVESGQCSRTLQGYSNWIRSVSWSPDGKSLVSGGADKLVRIWDAETGKCLKSLSGHDCWILSVQWSPDGKTIASSSADNTAKLWQVETGQHLRTLQGHCQWVYSIAWSPDGQTLATGSNSNGRSLRLWDAQTGECLNVLYGHNSWIWWVVWSPDGKQIATGGNDLLVKIWDRETGECLQTLRDARLSGRAIAWSPDGSTLATSSDERTILLWDIQTGRCLQELADHAGLVWALSWSPDGQVLASADEQGTIKLWNCTTGKCFRDLLGHESLVWAIAWSPDGQRLASSSRDGTIKIWDTVTETCLHTLRSDRPYEGMNITGVKGLTDAQKNTLKALGAIE
jgi:WD40 repeat protein